MRGSVSLLAGSVVMQFLLELTLGRIFIAPSLLVLALIHTGENRGGNWFIGGAFWAGVCLDLLLHQPPGASSLALLIGLSVSSWAGRFTAAEGIGNLIMITMVAVVVSDMVFIMAASRPVGSGFSLKLLLALPRGLLTAIVGAALLTVSSWVTDFRDRRTVA